MRRFILPLVLALVPSGLSAQGVILSEYRPGRAAAASSLSLTLSAEDKAVLDAMATSLVNIDTDTTTIIGHLDGVEGLLTTIDADTGNLAGILTSVQAIDTDTSTIITNTGNSATALQIIDDWDETDRAKVNLIVGQAGIAAGAGAVGVTVPRLTLASDDPAVVALQIIDNLVLAEDGIHASGESGLLILGVRNDAGTALAADGDRIPLSIDSSGAVRVTGGGGGVEYTEGDVDATITGHALLWEDAGNTLRSISSGTPLPVTCPTCSGSGVQHIDDAAFTGATDDIVPFGALFDATPPTITDGRAGLVRMDSSRYLYVVFPSAQAVSGTVTANLSATDNAVLDDIVDGTLQVQVSGVALTSLQLIDDAVSGTGFNISQLAGATTPMTTTQADNLALTLDALNVASFNYVYDGTNLDLMRGDATNGILVNLGTNNDVDTELPTAATLADDTANPSLPAVAAYMMAFDGTTWDRAQLASDNAQGSTTSGQTGPLMQAAVTTSAPTYTTAQTSPLSLTTAGLLRVAIESGGGSGGTSSNFGSAFPTPGTAIGLSDGTNMVAALATTTQADNLANTLDGLNATAFGYWFDGTTWDRAKGDSTDGLLVNLGANNDVTVTGTVTVTDGAGALNVIVDSGTVTTVSTVTSVSQWAGTAIPLLTATLADNLVNTQDALATVGLGYWFDGTAWDRAAGDSTNGLLVNLGTNNDVTVTGTVTANAGTGTFTVAGAKTNNNAAPGATNVGALVALANAAAPTWTEGNLVTLSTDLAGALRVTGGGGGTEYVVNGIAPADPTGATFVMERDDALSALTEVEGDWTNPRGNANGALWVAGDGTFTIAGTVTANAGTNLNTSALLTTTAHDAAFGTAGTADTQVRTVQGIASMTPLLVTLSGTNNVTNAGTFAVQVDGNALTSLQLIDDTIFADEAAFTYATSKVQAVGYVAESTTDAIADGSVGVPLMTLGRLAYAAAGATADSGQALSECVLVSAASTNATNCKASAGNFYGIDMVNTTTTTYYLRLYNLSSSPTCSSATGFIRSIPVPPAAAAGGAGGIVRIAPIGVNYGTGIGFCFTGGSSSTDNTNAATGVFGTVLYK